MLRSAMQRLGGAAAVGAAALVLASPASAAITVRNFSYTVAPGATLSVSAPGLLAGATDTDGGTLTAQGFGFGNHGGATINSDGSFEYKADQAFVGSDSFTYQACDSMTFNCVEGQVSVTIMAAYPTAQSQSYTVAPGATLSRPAGSLMIGSTVPAGDGLTASEVGFDLNTTVNSDGSFSYSADKGSVGGDSFTYQLCDTSTGLCSTTATVHLTITAPAPTAAKHKYTIAPGSTLSVPAMTLMKGSTAPHGDGLSAQEVGYNLDTEVNSQGGFDYTPFSDFVGYDSFSYELCDQSTGLCSTAAVASITVGIAPSATIPRVIRLRVGQMTNRIFKLGGKPTPKWSRTGRLPRGVRLVAHGAGKLELLGDPLRAARFSIRLRLKSSIFPAASKSVTILVGSR
jgi:VCBS repeat-containing protein